MQGVNKLDYFLKVSAFQVYKNKELEKNKLLIDSYIEDRRVKILRETLFGIDSYNLKN